MGEDFGDLECVVGLSDAGAETVVAVAGEDGVVGVAAGDDAADLRVDLAQPGHRLGSAHPSRDGEIEDDGGVGGARGARGGVFAECGLAVLDGDDLEPEALEEDPGGFADGGSSSMKRMRPWKVGSCSHRSSSAGSVMSVAAGIQMVNVVPLPAAELTSIWP